MHLLHTPPPAALTRPRRARPCRPLAASSSPTPPPPSTPTPAPSTPAPPTPAAPPQQPPKLPSRGYFAEANTQAEVYSKAGKNFDPAKKAGRWDPEFIWNTNWQEALALEEQAKARRAEAAAAAAAKKPDGGFLNFARLDDINTLDADLSERLAAPPPPPPPKIEMPNMTTRPAYSKPTQLEARKWTRGAKFSDKPFAQTPVQEDAAAEEAARVEAERAKYEQLKQEFLAWTLGLAGFTFGITWAFYTRDVAISYLIGAVGGVVYLRLLNRQVDGIGGGDIGGAVGPPRMLVPVILVLGYNRWNELGVEETGVALELIPMLLGFFTYKGGVIARQSLQLMNDITDQTVAQGADRSRRMTGGGLEGAGEGGPQGGRVPSIDDTMAKKILSN